MRWFSLAMSAVYIAAGIAIGLTDIALDLIPRYRTALGGVLIGYGLVRLVLWYRKQRQSEDDAKERS